MTVLIATDMSDRSRQALRQAAWLAHFTKQALHVLHVVEGLDDQYGWLVLLQTPEEIGQNVVAEQKAKLDAFVHETLDDFSHMDELHISQDIQVGEVIDVIVDLVDGNDDISTVVCGAQGHTGFAKYFIASTPNELIRVAPCPVLIVPDVEGDMAIEKILVSVDLQPDSQFILEHAKALAKSVGALVYPCFVIQWPQPMFDPLYAFTVATENREEIRTHQKAALDALCEMANLGDTLGQTFVLDGDIETTIQDTAKAIGADLVLMGTHARSGLRRFVLGNMSERILRSAPCSLYIVEGK